MATVQAALTALADRLNEQPNRLADLHTIRGIARADGVTGDWIDLLPPTGGAHHSEYAARLHTLAGGR